MTTSKNEAMVWNMKVTTLRLSRSGVKHSNNRGLIGGMMRRRSSGYLDGAMTIEEVGEILHKMDGYYIRD